jgi:guanine nucleotide-binding protein G(I)/G(S)/G(T) subunit beta-1
MDALKKQLSELTSQIESLRETKSIDLDLELTSASGSVQSLTSGKKDACKLRRNLKGHFGKVYALHWGVRDLEFEESPHLISASQDGKLIIWNGMTTNKVYAIPLRSSWVMTCAFEPTKGRMVACGGLDNLCSVYRLAKGNMNPHATELAHHDGYLSCCRFLNEENIITSSGDSTCLLWDIEKRRNIVEYSDHVGDVMSVDISPTDSENIFLSGSCDCTAKIWDKRVTQAANADKLCTAVMSFGSDTLDEDHAHESDINSVKFLPNGYSFVSGSDDSTVRLFDIRACGQLARYSELRILCGITSVAVSKTGRVVFAGYDDHSCWGWDSLRCGQNINVTERKPYELGGVGSGHDNRVSCVGMNSTGQAVATGSWDTVLKVWA